MSAPGRKHQSAWLRGALLLLCLPLLGMNREQFRFTRPVVANPGWSALGLPDDVLAQTNPDLSDLRLMSASGELPYVRESELNPVAHALPLTNVERVPGKETTALVDRGEHSEPCSQLRLEVAGSEPLLKPVVLEASEDGSTYRELTRSSLFRVAGGVMTTLNFPANTRRFLRIRLSDRESDPVTPEAVVLERPAPAPSLRTLPVTITRLATIAASDDTYTLQLPSQHLPLVFLHLVSAEPVFSRAVRVYERVLFRDHLTRREVSVGRIARAANGKESLDLPLSDISELNFEIDVERAGAPLLITEASVGVQQVRVVFLAPKAGPLELLYGVSRTSAADAPHYDLRAALALGLPEQLAPATLGAATDRGAPPPSAPVTPAGGTLNAAAWLRRAPIVLPHEGNLAYLDLGGEIDHSVRIVDQRHQQVPYVVESSSVHELRNAPFSVRTEGARTIATVAPLNPREKVVGIELQAQSPLFFSRAVAAYEAISDARAVTGQRGLGSGLWERRAEGEDSAAYSPFHLELDSPSQSTITLAIDNGDNPPLQLSSAAFQIERRRVDFVFNPSDQLSLWFANPNVGDPSYDLRLLGPALISSPARAATLGPTEELSPAAQPKPSKWLFIAVIVSGILVLLALVRTLRSESPSDKGNPQ